jgi:hypothetical protein
MEAKRGMLKKWKKEKREAEAEGGGQSEGKAGRCTTITGARTSDMSALTFTDQNKKKDT